MRGIIVIVLLLSISANAQMYRWRMSVMYPQIDSCFQATVTWGYINDTLGFVIEDTPFIFHKFNPVKNPILKKETLRKLRHEDKNLYRAALKNHRRWKQENHTVQNSIARRDALANPINLFKEKYKFLMELRTSYRYVIRWVVQQEIVHIQFLNVDNRKIECIMSFGYDLCDH